jgi:Putative zinc-finger
MYQEGPEGLRGAPCGEFDLKLTLLAAGELDSAESEEMQRHIQSCDGCRCAFQQESEVLALLSSNRPEPDANFLASCRAGLFDALDQQEERSWLRRLTGSFLPSSWLSPQPAWSAAFLLVIGFAVGLFGPRLLRHTPSAVSPIQNSSGSLSVAQSADSDSNSGAPNSTISSLDLHTADVAGINVFPAADNQPPQVQLQLNMQRPMTVSGTVDNDDVKRMLIHVLQDSQRNDPDVRLDAVDLLRIRNNDPEVRAALCRAVHTDHNAAVRLKAVEALDGAEPQNLVRQTLLDALVDDQNPGVRVEAINELRDMAARGEVNSDDHLLAVLQDRIKKDPSTYIRLQSAAVIRDLGPRQKF